MCSVLYIDTNNVESKKGGPRTEDKAQAYLKAQLRSDRSQKIQKCDFVHRTNLRTQGSSEAGFNLPDSLLSCRCYRSMSKFSLNTHFNWMCACF